MFHVEHFRARIARFITLGSRRTQKSNPSNCSTWNNLLTPPSRHGQFRTPRGPLELFHVEQFRAGSGLRASQPPDPTGKNPLWPARARSNCSTWNNFRPPYSRRNPLTGKSCRPFRGIMTRVQSFFASNLLITPRVARLLQSFQLHCFEGVADFPLEAAGEFPQRCPVLHSPRALRQRRPAF